MLKNILKTMKINHYVKNIIVFVPLIFSINLFNVPLLIKAFTIFISFCSISSVVYILNDIIDKDKDKLHPIKCNRPIASGKLTIQTAIFVLVILLLISSVLAFYTSILSLLTVLIYLILNIFYSLKLKNIELVDVVCIALGFILRILAGCFAISVIPSPLVILLTFFFSMFFTFSKRKLELLLIKTKGECRNSIKDYTPEMVNQFILLNAILTIAFYFTYMLDETTIQRAGTEFLYISVIPFSMIILRLLYQVNSIQTADDPINFIYKDKMTKIFIGLYLLTLFILLTIY